MDVVDPATGATDDEELAAAAETDEELGEPEAPPEPPVGASQDPRRSVVDVLRRRLEAVLQPVDDDDAWHGVYAITRKELTAVLMQDLPDASETSAAVRTPAFIYVDAVCGRCHIATSMLLNVSPELRTDSAGASTMHLKAKSASMPHVCYQTRISDVTPTRSVPGQQAMDEIDVEEDDAVDETPSEAADSAIADDQPRLDLGSCSVPGCVLADEHPGPHASAAGDHADDDGDLLPF